MRINQIAICMLFVLLCGCNVIDIDWPSKTTTCGVEGHITLDGQAIADVKLVFIPQRVGKEGDLNRIASASSNDRGEFVLEVDSKKAKQIRHGRYRVIVSKIVDGEELFHESYNSESTLMLEVNSQEAIQRPKLELVKSGTY